MPIISSITRKQEGLTLIELMISITIGIFVISALVFLISSTIRSNTDTIRSTRLNQELRAAMQMITRDLRRAGYRYGSEFVSIFTSQNSLNLSATSGNITVTPVGTSFGVWIKDARIRQVVSNVAYCIDITDPTASTSGTSFASATGTYVDCDLSTNPTAFPTSSISAGSWTVDYPSGNIEVTANCTSFGYDRDNDEGNGSIDASERIAYRSSNNALQIGSGISCSDTTGWETLINPSEGGIKITNFSITKTGEHLIPAGNIQVNLLELQLSLTGELDKDSSVQRTITESVKMRNDQIM